MSSIPPSGEKSYFVLDQSGAKYGPATVVQLNQWAAEGRVLRLTTLEDSVSGQQMPASSVPGLIIPEAGQSGTGGNPYADAPSYGSYQRPNQAVNVPNNLVKSILATLCCCLPLGIAAIVNAAQVDGHNKRGDYMAAKAASDRADKFANWAIIGGVIVGIIQTVMMLSGKGMK